jgi:hypothetical protein
LAIKGTPISNKLHITTLVELPEKPTLEYETVTTTTGGNETLLAALRSHITLLQTELETLEMIMKRHNK